MRLITYNIQNWHDQNKIYSFDTIRDTLIHLNADVIFLTEVNARYDRLKKLAEELKMYHIFFPANSPLFGNAILSKKHIKTVKTIKLSTHRALSICLLGDIHIAVTHLDHVSEETRLEQCKIIYEETKTFPYLILAGDFNCLSRRDYTEDEWQAIETERRQYSREKPASFAYEFLSEHFVDALSTFQRKPEFFFTAHTINPMYRIDYFWLSRDMLKKYRVTRYKTDSNAKGSDHLPLLIELT